MGSTAEQGACTVLLQLPTCTGDERATALEEQDIWEDLEEQSQDGSLMEIGDMQFLPASSAFSSGMALPSPLCFPLACS